VEEDVAEWDAREERVKFARRRRLGAIVLKEQEFRSSGVQESRSLEFSTLVRGTMMGVVRQRGIASLPWGDAANTLRGRMDFLARVFPEDAWPRVDDETLLEKLDDWLGDDLAQTPRWRDVASLDLCHALRRLLRGRERELDALAPVRMEAPSGSEIRLRYDMGADGPVMSVRLQEVFGMAASPRVARGRVAVTVELLSPAQRPIHITRDLDHFWDNGYIHVRKEMRGRYPKHDWPEDPRAAPPRRNSLKKH
ncbi:MAG: ATP-dependent helicase HrpB, partial [Kiritimatiellaeota bacterium]|nr:ATP-dependent helicase HrpB [Kiritimatiellota bacterium]